MTVLASWSLISCRRRRCCRGVIEVQARQQVLDSTTTSATNSKAQEQVCCRIVIIFLALYNGLFQVARVGAATGSEMDVMLSFSPTTTTTTTNCEMKICFIVYLHMLCRKMWEPSFHMEGGLWSFVSRETAHPHSSPTSSKLTSCMIDLSVAVAALTVFNKLFPRFFPHLEDCLSYYRLSLHWLATCRITGSKSYSIRFRGKDRKAPPLHCFCETWVGLEFQVSLSWKKDTGRSLEPSSVRQEVF